MDFNFWIGFLKVISMLSAGLFGALGLITKYKDENNKITKWGTTALIGIFISTSISLGLHILETSKAKAAAVEAKAESDATKEYLQDISAKAQITADQQKISLDETNRLKTGLEETLAQTNTIKKGMDATLQEQQANSLRTSQIAGDMKTTLRQQTDIFRGQEQQLDELRRLYLAQYRLGGMEVSWRLSSEILQRARQIFEETNVPDKVYLATALRAGGENFVGVKRARGDQPKLFLFLGRPQGYLTKEYMPNSPEWKAFEQVLQLIRSSEFMIALAPDIPLSKMNNQLWPSEAIVSGGRVVFTIQNPDVKLSQLKDGQWIFRGYYNNQSQTPKKIRLRSLDSIVLLDSELELDWKERETGELLYREPGDSEARTAFFSGPHKIPVVFNKLLFPGGK
jgi:hypothetical protein